MTDILHPTSRELAAPAALRQPAQPGATYRAHQREIDGAVQRVFASGWYLQGRENDAFEAEFARYHGVAHTVTAGSGTDALELALRTLGIGPGDAVVTVSHTAVATVSAVNLVGALPVLVDVNPSTYTMDPERLEAVLRSTLGRRVRAVIPVHLYGHPADMEAIGRIADRHGVPIIEDCAQAHGAEIVEGGKGRKVGTFGAFGAFSFYPTKNLGAFGDGGALITGDARLAERARCLKQYGWKERYVSHLAGMNTRLDELQAAVLRVKLPYLDRDNARRREIAGLYQRHLSGTGLALPHVRSGVAHVFHQYTVRTDRRDALRAFLEARGIGSAVLYPVPVHLQPGYRDHVAVGTGGLARTERLCRRILSLPMHPALTDDEAGFAAEAVAAWCDREEAE